MQENITHNAELGGQLPVMGIPATPQPDRPALGIPIDGHVEGMDENPGTSSAQDDDDDEPAYLRRLHEDAPTNILLRPSLRALWDTGQGRPLRSLHGGGSSTGDGRLYTGSDASIAEWEGGNPHGHRHAGDGGDSLEASSSPQHASSWGRGDGQRQQPDGGGGSPDSLPQRGRRDSGDLSSGVMAAAPEESGAEGPLEGDGQSEEDKWPRSRGVLLETEEDLQANAGEPPASCPDSRISRGDGGREQGVPSRVTATLIPVMAPTDPPLQVKSRQ